MDRPPAISQNISLLCSWTEEEDGGTIGVSEGIELPPAHSGVVSVIAEISMPPVVYVYTYEV